MMMVELEVSGDHLVVRSDTDSGVIPPLIGTHGHSTADGAYRVPLLKAFPIITGLGMLAGSEAGKIRVEGLLPAMRVYMKMKYPDEDHEVEPPVEHADEAAKPVTVYLTVAGDRLRLRCNEDAHPIVKQSLPDLALRHGSEATEGQWELPARHAMHLLTVLCVQAAIYPNSLYLDGINEAFDAATREHKKKPVRTTDPLLAPHALRGFFITCVATPNPCVTHNPTNRPERTPRLVCGNRCPTDAGADGRNETDRPGRHAWSARY